MIGIVDYGLGNIRAFLNVYRRLGIPATAADSRASLESASKLILPGVGAFDWALQRLDASGLREPLDEMVLERKVDVLGVCVGMQMMARSSEEGDSPGLGWIDADVRRIEDVDSDRQPMLPHMGWNDAAPAAADSLFRGIESPRYYFLHSYCVVPDQPDCTLATTEYGGRFTSAVQVGNVYGTQFHPEKSHHWGVQLLQNFAGGQ